MPTLTTSTPNAPTPKAHNGAAWVAFADVYGFKQQVRTYSETLETLLSQVADAQSQAERSMSAFSALFRLSDNVFLVTPVHKEDAYKAFSLLVSDLRHVIDAHLARDLPIRGGIAYGRISMAANMLIGEPVARAVEYERRIGVPLIVLPESEARLAGVTRRLKPFAALPFPSADGRPGLTAAKIIKPRRPAEYRQYAAAKYKEALVSGPPHVAQAWKTTVDLMS